MRPILPVSGMNFLLQLLLLPCIHARLQGQTKPHLDVGAFCGFEFTDGVEEPRLGLQSEIGFGGFGVTAAFALIQPNLYMEEDGGAWQLYLTGRFRPLGARSWLSLGYGLTIQRRWTTWVLSTTRPTRIRTNTTDAALVGVALPLGRFRPFVDILVTPFFDNDGQFGGHALFGLVVNVL